MTVKTITLDLEAHEILTRHESPEHSFSQVIKQHLGSARTSRDLRRALDRISLSEETLDSIEAWIAACACSKLQTSEP